MPWIRRRKRTAQIDGGYAVRTRPPVSAPSLWDGNAGVAIPRRGAICSACGSRTPTTTIASATTKEWRAATPDRHLRPAGRQDPRSLRLGLPGLPQPRLHREPRHARVDRQPPRSADHRRERTGKSHILKALTPRACEREIRVRHTGASTSSTTCMRVSPIRPTTPGSEHRRARNGWSSTTSASASCATATANRPSRTCSFYAYDRICDALELTPNEYLVVRKRLIDKDLIAFDGRRFQVPVPAPDTHPAGTSPGHPGGLRRPRPRHDPAHHPVVSRSPSLTATSLVGTSSRSIPTTA